MSDNWSVPRMHSMCSMRLGKKALNSLCVFLIILFIPHSIENPQVFTIDENITKIFVPSPHKYQLGANFFSFHFTCCCNIEPSQSNFHSAVEQWANEYRLSVDLKWFNNLMHRWKTHKLNSMHFSIIVGKIKSEGNPKKKEIYFERKVTGYTVYTLGNH